MTVTPDAVLDQEEPRAKQPQQIRMQAMMFIISGETAPAVVRKNDNPYKSKDSNFCRSVQLNWESSEAATEMHRTVAFPRLQRNSKASAYNSENISGPSNRQLRIRKAHALMVCCWHAALRKWSPGQQVSPTNPPSGPWGG
jgi:hypothetical protein